VQVVAICGRNRRLRRRLERLATRCAGRLTVLGFVPNMADWLRCADIVAGKAGPGTIAEAACCGAPLILTAQLPGQEKGNAAFVTEAGAGRYVPQVRRLAREVARLRADPAALEAMRGASARLARPDAAATVATALATLADSHQTQPDPGPEAALMIVKDFGCGSDQNPSRSAVSLPDQWPMGPVGLEVSAALDLAETAGSADAGPGLVEAEPGLAEAESGLVEAKPGVVGTLAGLGAGHGD